MTQHIFTKQGGNFERKLSPEMIEQYFTSQNNSPNPISPLEFQAQQAGQGGTLAVDSTTPFQSSQTPQAPNYADTFNNVMLEILKKAQGVDNVELLKRKRALERASLDAASAPTPEELRTLSPNQQSAIRSGNVKALSSEIDENAYLLAKAESQIDNFYKSFEAVSKLGAEFAEKMPLPEKVKESFVTALQQRPISDWNSMLAGLSDKNKSEVLSLVDYSNITEESAVTKPLSVGDQLKLEEKQTKQDIVKSEILDTYSLINEILNNPKRSLVTGLSRFSPTAYLPGAGLIKNQIIQLQQILSLDNRQKLKGSGSVSDFEAKMLAQAATALGTNLSDDDFDKELKKIRGAFANASGIAADVSITDPNTGRTKTGTLDRRGINEAISQGFIIEYI